MKIAVCLAIIGSAACARADNASQLEIALPVPAAIASPMDTLEEISSTRESPRSGLSDADRHCFFALAGELSTRVIPPAERAKQLFINQQVRQREQRRVEGNVQRACDIERTIVYDFEYWKFDTYLKSGVVPKTYFGYFDRRGETADAEGRFLAATARATDAVNAWLTSQRDPLRVTDAEIAVTFIAEGGALLLRSPQELAVPIHPVFSVGLDDVALGSRELPELMAALDIAVGTRFVDVVAWVERDAATLPIASTVPDSRRWLLHGNVDAKRIPYLTRYLTLEEAIVGTALMWVWEKQLAGRKLMQLAGDPGVPLSNRSLEMQFIIGSLVYNSGLLHTAERWEAIRTFHTAKWIYDRSEANAKTRWRLNVQSPARMRQQLLSDGKYPDQPTAWLAGYHVLQRYGGYVGLKKFGGVFDEQDMLIERAALIRAQ